VNDDVSKHHRRSIRLRGYDYTQAGAYFVTIVMRDRACLFGEVVNGEMRRNDGGRMIEQWWFELNHKFSTVETDEFMIMPNHFHGIVVISGLPVGADLRVGPNSEGAHVGAPLPTIIQWFKTMTTNTYMRGVKTQGWPRFHGQLWQRNYYEHIVRSESELSRIREYIANNPAQWEMDREHPLRPSGEANRKAEPWEV
jgi:REP element-mobilizing transposase RayT